jgi:hypothetical protein
MNRDEREQAIWHDAYMLAMSQDPHPTESSGWADAAVEAFRKRYPPQPTAPKAAWYDEPPFERDGVVHRCWVEGCSDPQSVFWSIGRREWKHFACNTAIHRLAGRRVSPIVKPQEPTA